MRTARSPSWCAPAAARALSGRTRATGSWALTWLSLSQRPQEQRVEHAEQRTAVCLGSAAQVAACADAMRGGKVAA